LKVLFLSPEMVPFCKTGGLADVAGALPLALKQLGVDVRSVLPYYSVVQNGNFDSDLMIKDLAVPLGKEILRVNIWEADLKDEMPVYLVERKDMYDRPGLYGNEDGDYYDNLERFSLFCHGALMLTDAIRFQPDIIHCHDWQTGLVPALLYGPYAKNTAFSQASTVFTIHNIGYQGIFHAERLPSTGLPKDAFFHPGGVEYWEKISLLKSGIVYSDRITTVSPKYAREIQSAEFGMGMEGILKQRKDALAGILNGIDVNLWDPARDGNISASYSLEVTDGKAACKEALLREMALDPDLKSKPLLGMISRLDTQKGFDLLLEILEDLMAMDVGLVILGSGNREIEASLKMSAKRYPKRLALSLGFNDPLAHRIMAGADIFLIPSRYEPCGLTQMYALRYGTIPVVRATGGLDDTVDPFDLKSYEGNGFKFSLYQSESFLKAVQTAVTLFADSNVWGRIIANGMKTDFSWRSSAQKYLELYEKIYKYQSTTRPALG
jgi:starch synthase